MATKKTTTTAPKEATPKLSPVETTVKALKKEGVEAEIWEAGSDDAFEGLSYIRLKTKETTRLIQVRTADLGKEDFISTMLSQVQK